MIKHVWSLGNQFLLIFHHGLQMVKKLPWPWENRAWLIFILSILILVI